MTGGGYLHSHPHNYPAEFGPAQQQITTYAHKDDNNNWHIKRYNKLPPSWNSTKPVDYVRNGDLIRLEHLDSGRNLHAHKVIAPVTTKHLQVTGYGEVCNFRNAFMCTEKLSCFIVILRMVLEILMIFGVWKLTMVKRRKFYKR